MSKKAAPGAARLAASEQEEQAPSPVRDISEQLDAALANGHDPEPTTALAINGALDLPGTFSETGLVLPAGLSYQEWEAVGFKLRRINKGLQWAVGDWLNYGYANFSEMASQLEDLIGVTYKEAANWKWVAGAIPISRRRENVEWSKHEAVARLDPPDQELILKKAEDLNLTVTKVREIVKGPKPVPEPGSMPALAGPLMRYCSSLMSTAQIVSEILRVSFPDAQTALDVTYGTGGFWDGTANVKVTGVDISPTRSPDDPADFRDLIYSDNSFDVVVFDPPHLADGGEDGIMAQRYGTYSDDELEEVVRDGVKEAWRVGRLGIIVKVTDHVHGQQFVSMTDWVRYAVTSVSDHEQPGTALPYDVVHQVRDHAIKDPRWNEQLSAYNNGSTYLIFRAGSQRHELRSA